MDIYLHLIFCIIFCIKFTIYVYIKYIKNNNYENISFIFLLYNTLTEKLDGNTFG